MVTRTASTEGRVPAVPIPPKIQKAAREFEVLLLATLLGPLEKTFSALPGEEQPAGLDTYNSLGMQAVSTALANHGGLGIANMVARSLVKSGSHR